MDAIVENCKILYYTTTFDATSICGVNVFAINAIKNFEHIKIGFISQGIPNLEQQKVFAACNVSNYTIPLYKSRFARYMWRIHTNLKLNKEYRAIHIHSGNHRAVPILVISKLCGFTTIWHSHNTSNGLHSAAMGLLFSLFKQLIPLFTDHYFACSELAAKHLFPKRVLSKVRILKNGIEVKKYQYNMHKRAEMRDALQLNGKFVIGHVGRLEYQKNHDFLVDVFSIVHKKKKDTVLLLIGEGSLRPELEEKVQRLGLQEYVIFTGMRIDVEALLQAMDVFVLPSHYEGLGIVLIEAQASGLKSIASNVVPNEAQITPELELLPLAAGAEVWANKILIYKDGYDRRNTYDEIVAAGYDIKETAKQLEEFYLTL